ncbi:uncharacterized protein C8Q71DRAFT_723325 [Rhodofomes roseus]|uniref:Uncharacterized protein n=1 Tax=Rhodofomes roseus TaxID=34475 RepID=A0ABQ8KGG6_9APHY|nr:uncharacterized protein C8Q71DRAFT_723325 [Rhodofomes roseus]KAH9836942.1 hypothetical protein C8Q71DRAFT_723325 [Rhodofomes roseus]
MSAGGIDKPVVYMQSHKWIVEIRRRTNIGPPTLEAELVGVGAEVDHIDVSELLICTGKSDAAVSSSAVQVHQRREREHGNGAGRAEGSSGERGPGQLRSCGCLRVRDGASNTEVGSMYGCGSHTAIGARRGQTQIPRRDHESNAPGRRPQRLQCTHLVDELEILKVGNSFDEHVQHSLLNFWHVTLRSRVPPQIQPLPHRKARQTKISLADACDTEAGEKRGKTNAKGRMDSCQACGRDGSRRWACITSSPELEWSASGKLVLETALLRRMALAGTSQWHTYYGAWAMYGDRPLM